MLKITLIVLAVTAIACESFTSDNAYVEFQNFLIKHNKSYQTIEEYINRFNIFKSNYERFQNAQIEEGQTHREDLTQFSDLSFEEFRKLQTLKVTHLHQLKQKSQFLQFISDDDVPESLDWREHGAVTDVKDQKSCGSCWAFSTTGNIEGVYFVKNKKLLSFSEQQLVDCDKVDEGCNGGLMENSIDYIFKEGGLQLESDYSYKGNSGSCKADRSKEIPLKLKGHKFAPSQDETEIKAFLAQYGPLAIAVNANPLQFYSRGILDKTHSQCDPEGVNHAVLLVGYGSENGKDYWIIKNSWGQRWGEKGYFRIARGKGVCGVNTYVITADLE